MSQERIGGKLFAAMQNLDTLPAMPEIARRLLALPLNTEDGEAQMLRLIAQDAQLSAKIVGLANSPAMGIQRGVSSIHDAAMLLGMQRLKSVVIGMATLSQLSHRAASKNFDPHDLWSHSLTVAIAMNLLAQSMPDADRPEENRVFLAGLLHDIGLMVLHHVDFAASNELHHQVRLQPKRPICEIELELFGVTHNFIGAQLLRHWNLPGEIVEVASRHHTARDKDGTPASLLAKMVNVSERLLQDFGIAEHNLDPVGEDEWRGLGIDPARSGELAAEISEVAIQVIQLPDTYATPLWASAEQHTAGSVSGAARYSPLSAPARMLHRWMRKVLHRD